MSTHARIHVAFPRIGFVMVSQIASVAKMKPIAMLNVMWVNSRVLQKLYHQENDDRTIASIKSTSAMVTRIACKEKTKRIVQSFIHVCRIHDVKFVSQLRLVKKNATVKLDMFSPLMVLLVTISTSASSQTIPAVKHATTQLVDSCKFSKIKFTEPQADSYDSLVVVA